MKPWILTWLAGVITLPIGSSCCKNHQDPPSESRLEARILELLDRLANPAIDIREQATAEIRRLLPQAESILRRHLQDSDPEVLARCRDLLDQPADARSVA